MTKGYLNIGSSSKDEAKEKVGIQLHLKNKPNFIRRFFYWFCFKIYWIDEDMGEVNKKIKKNDI